MTKARLKELLYNAIFACEYEYEQQDFETDKELHGTLLNELEMTEEEYMEIMKRRYSW
jgi:hypothetical protein